MDRCKKSGIFLLAIFLIGQNQYAQAMQSPPLRISNTATISIHFDKIYHGDTLYIQLRQGLTELGDRPLDNKGKLAMKEYWPGLDKEGNAKIVISGIKKYGYFYLSKGAYLINSYPFTIINGYLLESGDNIKININSDTFYATNASDRELSKRRYNISYTGKGYYKFQWQQKYCGNQPYNPGWDNSIARTYRKLNGQIEAKPSFTSAGIYNRDCREEITLKHVLAELSSYKDKMSVSAYNICKADIVGDYYKSVARSMGFLRKDSGKIVNFRQSVFILDSFMLALDSELPVYAKLFSKNYSEGVYQMERKKFNLFHGMVDGELFNLIKSKYKGKFRDKLVMLFFIEDMSTKMKNSAFLLQEAIAINGTPAYSHKLKQLLSSVEGALAYNFSLPDQFYNYISLRKLYGKVIFIDFYFNGCHGCSLFYKNVLKNIEEKYKENGNIVFLSISIDKTRERWLNALASGLYTSSSDSNVINLFTDGKGADHPLVNYYNIQGFPYTFLIGKDGKIIEKDNRDLLTNKDLLISFIERALYESFENRIIGKN